MAQQIRNKIGKVEQKCFTGLAIVREMHYHAQTIQLFYIDKNGKGAIIDTCHHLIDAMMTPMLQQLGANMISFHRKGGNWHPHGLLPLSLYSYKFYNLTNRLKDDHLMIKPTKND